MSEVRENWRRRVASRLRLVDALFATRRGICVMMAEPYGAVAGAERLAAVAASGRRR